MSDKVVVREVAEAEFNRFVDLMDLDLSESEMDDDDKKSFAEQKERVLKAIENGSAVVNDAGEITFTPRRSKDAKAITFYEPTGASLMAMDRKKKSQDVGKFYAALEDMTKQPPGTFAKLKIGDLKVCMAIGTLFLG